MNVFEVADAALPPYLLFQKLRARGGAVPFEVCINVGEYGHPMDFHELVFRLHDWGRALGSYVREAGGSAEDLRFFNDYASRHGANIVVQALISAGYAE